MTQTKGKQIFDFNFTCKIPNIVLLCLALPYLEWNACIDSCLNASLSANYFLACKGKLLRMQLTFSKGILEKQQTCVWDLPNEVEGKTRLLKIKITTRTTERNKASLKRMCKCKVTTQYALNSLLRMPLLQMLLDGLYIRNFTVQTLQI